MHTEFKNFIFTEAEVISGEADQTMSKDIGWADIQSIRTTTFKRDSFKTEQCFLFTVIYEKIESSD